MRVCSCCLSKMLAECKNKAKYARTLFMSLQPTALIRRSLVTSVLLGLSKIWQWKISKILSKKFCRLYLWILIQGLQNFLERIFEFFIVGWISGRVILAKMGSSSVIKWILNKVLHTSFERVVGKYVSKYFPLGFKWLSYISVL